jgi:hypothetical protein
MNHTHTRLTDARMMEGNDLTASKSSQAKGGLLLHTQSDLRIRKTKQLEPSISILA